MRQIALAVWDSQLSALSTWGLFCKTDIHIGLKTPRLHYCQQICQRIKNICGKNCIFFYKIENISQILLLIPIRIIFWNRSYEKWTLNVFNLNPCICLLKIILLCRRNNEHRATYCHPGDPDHRPDTEDLRPDCPFGATCYQTNVAHRRQFRHMGKPAPKPSKPNVTLNVGCPYCLHCNGYDSNFDYDDDYGFEL